MQCVVHSHWLSAYDSDSDIKEHSTAAVVLVVGVCYLGHPKNLLID